MYKSNLEIQKLKREAEKNDLGPEVVALIDKKIEDKLKSGMHAITNEVRNKFQHNEDNDRCNELEIQLRMELVHVARRINQGAAYEIRAGLPNKPKELIGDEKEDQQAVLKHKEAMETFEEKNKNALEINTAGLRLSTAIEEIPGGTQLLMDYEKLTEAVQHQASGGKKK